MRENMDQKNSNLYIKKKKKISECGQLSGAEDNRNKENIIQIRLVTSLLLL